MLTKRLNNLLAALPVCNVLADVGCDHGYIGLEALSRNVAGKVIFIDVSMPSLQKARQNCPQPLKMRAEFICQDGLQEICADCAVIAGMGGLEILSVLERAKHLPQTLVLQPMRNQADVRKWLTKCYNVTVDYKFFDGKFYDLLVAQKCAKGCTYSTLELAFGKDNLISPTPDFLAYLNKEKQEYEQILQQCKNAEIVQKYQQICRVFDAITEEQK